MVASPKCAKAVAQFIGVISEATRTVESAGHDTGRLLTRYSVKFESTKKIQNADFVVGMAGGAHAGGPLIVERRFDPNDPSWLREKDILPKIGTVAGISVGQTEFRAVVRKLDIKSKPGLCWVSTEGILTKYSLEVVSIIGRLSAADIKAATNEYKASYAGRRSKR
jgi:hypothetical protein